jgi:hypothetical protein
MIVPFFQVVMNIILLLKRIHGFGLMSQGGGEVSVGGVQGLDRLFPYVLKKAAFLGWGVFVSFFRGVNIPHTYPPAPSKSM